MGVDIYWKAVPFSAVQLAEKAVEWELPCRRTVSSKTLREVCERYLPADSLLHVRWIPDTDEWYGGHFDGMRTRIFRELLPKCELDLSGWPTAFGNVECFFPMWSYCMTGRKDHDLRGKHAANTSLRRLLIGDGYTILSPRDVRYRREVFSLWQSRPELRGISRRVDRFLNDVNKFLNHYDYRDWKKHIHNHLEILLEMRNRPGLPTGARIHSLPSSGSAEAIARCESARSGYQSLALGRFWDDGWKLYTLGDFSVDELVTFEQTSGWSLDEVVEVMSQGDRLSMAFTDRQFRNFTQGYLCEHLAYGFREAAKKNLAIVFWYSC